MNGPGPPWPFSTPPFSAWGLVPTLRKNARASIRHPPAPALVTRMGRSLRNRPSR